VAAGKRFDHAWKSATGKAGLGLRCISAMRAKLAVCICAVKALMRREVRGWVLNQIKQ